MRIFPAIDLYQGKAVRLYKGDYSQMTVYNEDPLAVALHFASCGAKDLHVVDLEGAKTGETPALETVKTLIEKSGLSVEIGGGIRNMRTVDRYIAAGAARVILGTAAVSDGEFLRAAVDKYGEKIAVGVDIKDGKAAIRGWTESSGKGGEQFCKEMAELGVKTLIVTDISKDGVMQGANHELYKRLNALGVRIIASGGVSSLDDVVQLKNTGVYGAIIGKAYYVGAIKIDEAVEKAK